MEGGGTPSLMSGSHPEPCSYSCPHRNAETHIQTEREMGEERGGSEERGRETEKRSVEGREKGGRGWERGL